ncbi:hypothetical protein ACFQ49_06370 [Kroppenstedtia eburnea]|uniref:YfjL-like protein n=1 Tax=Kroppenstedtia eburnea TaxID=714067 RepID=UPI003643B9AC
MKKKVYTVLLVLLVGLVLFLYNAFNGNPVSQLVSKTALENYLAATYPEKELRVDDGFYDFKFGGTYEFDVTEIGSDSNKYEFIVSGFFKPEVTWDGIRDDRLDEKLMDRLSKEAAREITSLLKSEVKNVKSVEVYLEVLKGQLDPDVPWDKTLRLEEGPLEIDVVLDSAQDRKKDFLQHTKKIQSLLNQEGYDYQWVTIIWSDFTEERESGVGKFSTAFGPKTRITLKDIEKEDP